MSNKINMGILLALLLFGKAARCQTAKDTALMVDEFSRVMSFTMQPYLYYSTTSTLTSTPLLQEQDTATFTGMFYKNGEDIYSDNGTEEIYMQDSLLIRISRKRKSIWVSRADATARERLNVLPVNKRELQELFRRHYTIQKTMASKAVGKIGFISRGEKDKTSALTTTITLEYTLKDAMPISMEIQIGMQQPLSDEMLAGLKDKNIDDKVLQTIQGVKYLLRTQRVSVQFLGINNTKEVAAKMPSWKGVLEYDSTKNEFVAKGLYAAYEVTKMF